MEGREILKRRVSKKKMLETGKVAFSNYSKSNSVATPANELQMTFKYIQQRKSLLAVAIVEKLCTKILCRRNTWYRKIRRTKNTIREGE